MGPKSKPILYFGPDEPHSTELRAFGDTSSTDDCVVVLIKNINREKELVLKQ